MTSEPVRQAWFRHPDGRWIVGDAGRQPLVRTSPLPPGSPPDIAVDGARAGALTYRAASLRGFAHLENEVPRQDSYEVRLTGDRQWLVGCVADGVSAARHAHIGAQIVCSRVTGLVCAALEDAAAITGIPWQAVAEAVNDDLTERASQLLPSGADRVPGLPEARGILGSTALAFVVATRPARDGHHAAVVVNLAGDTSVFLLDSGSWTPLIVPKDLNGPVFSNVVSALPTDVDVRLVTVRVGPEQALVVLTDGLADPLGTGKGQVGQFLAAHWRTPPDELDFEQQVGFYRKTFVDDRTAVAVWADPR